MWIPRQEWHDFQDETLSVLYQILHLLKTSIGQEQTMAKGLDDLRNAAASQTSVVASISTLLQGLAQQLKDAANSGDDDNAVEELANQIMANTSALAQAVTANTPAASSGSSASAPSAPASSPTTDSAASTPADNTAPASPPDNQGSGS
jgi:hypothetical protein